MGAQEQIDALYKQRVEEYKKDEVENSIEMVKNLGNAFTDNKFTVKDSGERRQFDSGMQRDTNANKIRYDLIFDGPMLERFADHLTKGAVKYEARNWMKAEGEEELARFKESAVRHFFQWIKGENDEDHAAAVYFNINGYEYVKERLSSDK